MFIVIKVKSSVESTVIKKIEEFCRESGIQLNSVECYSSGLNESIFGNIEIGNSDIVIPIVRAHYSLRDIIKNQRLESISIEGLNINATVENNTLHIDGLPELSSPLSENPGSQDPVVLPDITIKDSVLKLNALGTVFVLPINIDIHSKENNTDITGNIRSNLGNIELKAMLDNEFQGNISVDILKCHIDELLSLFPSTRQLFVEGDAEIQTEIKIADGKIQEVSAQLLNKTYKIHSGLFSADVTLGGNVQLNSEIKPEALSITGTVIQLSVGKDVSVKDVSFHVEQLDKDLVGFHFQQGKGEVPFSFTFNADGVCENIFDAPRLVSDFSVTVQKGSISKGDVEFSVNHPVTIHGNSSVDLTSMSFTGAASIAQKLDTILNGTHIQSDKISQSVTFKGNKDSVKLNSTSVVKNSSVDLVESGVFDISEVKLKSNLIFNTQGLKNYQSDITVTQFNFNDKKGLEIIGGNLSVNVDSTKTLNVGQLNITSAVTPDITLNHVLSNLVIDRTQNNTVKFKGNAELPVSPLMLDFEGHIADSDTAFSSVDFSMAPSSLDKDTDFSPLSSDLEGLYFKGEFALEGHADINRLFDVKSTAILSIKNCFISDVQKTWHVDNMSTSIEFRDFMNLSSKNNQLITFDAAGTESLSIENGRIRFSIINDESVQIEKIKGNLCEGTVFTTGFLISPESDSIDVDVYCQKLSLTQLLNTFLGKKKAKGAGYLSGIIPVSYAGGNITFEKSFLHSIPGEKGVIQIEDGSDITGGVLLAEEAVKDFNYDFATVDFETINNNLNLVLRLDGKPAGKLPLVYDEKLGDFRKTLNNEKHVDLQGLQLDLKFVDIDINQLIKKQSKLKFVSD